MQSAMQQHDELFSENLTELLFCNELCQVIDERCISITGTKSHDTRGKLSYLNECFFIYKYP